MVNPELHEAIEGVEGVVPIYGRAGPLAGARLRKVLHQAAEATDLLEDPLPHETRTRVGVMDLSVALRRLHQPDDTVGNDHLECCRRRLAFDELLSLCLSARQRRLASSRAVAPRCRVTRATLRSLSAILPFRLTAAQERGVREIARDLEGPRPMTRLLQGDVGCGKTVVAAVAMLVAAQNEFQAVIMAPTELVASQHHRTLVGLLESAGHEVALLTGRGPIRERREARSRIASGAARIVVGTHALFSDAVNFHRLGLVVVDEQHRFGVLQRQTLVEKGTTPHLLVMTATPIPRSLALTVHGDLDLTVIDELPPGRRPVRTVQRTDAARLRLIAFLRREIADGGRVYWVFPTIDRADDLEVPALLEEEAAIRRDLPDARIAVVHGRLATAEREDATEGFRSGAVDVLLATTVVEVGVDVPEASVMLIEGAERFGLSQLHQLRGRVGRGSRPSWCVLLVGPDPTPTARRRLDLFCSTHDGFVIAEADLELRGPGELDGTRQSGRLGLRFADLSRDGDLVARAHREATRLEESGESVAVATAIARVLGSHDPGRFH
jgi:ATP-dependent DNA helicase RecG